MKKSKRNKNLLKSPSQSSKKISEPSSVRGLVTNKQQSIKTQSQVSSYTQKSQRSNTFASSQDFDFPEEQIQKQDNHELFVSQQQEKVIQKILQVARKGKINQKNAFQIPLKVLDNENFSTGKTKFWKFASELLGASMNIYEKRVQNTWINTNMIHDKLARMIVKKFTQQENQQVQQATMSRKASTSQFLMMPIDQFRDPKILDNIRLGQQTLEAPQKINISKIKQQYTFDPMFQRKIKAFDNTSLKGILLNIFNVSSSCQIQLFHQKNKSQAKKITETRQSRKDFVELRLQNLNEIIHQIKYNPTIFQTVDKISNSLTTSEQKIERLDTQIDTNQRNDIQKQLQEFLSQPIETLQSQVPFFQNNYDNSMIKRQEQDSNTVPSEFGLFSNDSVALMSQKNPDIFHEDGTFSYSELDKSFHSVMTPWQMEFKQGKLKKKSTKRKPKNEQKKRQKIQPSLVQFDASKSEIPKLVMSVNKLKLQKQKQKTKQKQRNLIPPQLVVYQKLNFKKIHKNSEKTIKQQIRSQPQIPDFLAPDPSMMDDHIQQNQQNSNTHLNNIKQQEIKRTSQQIMFLNNISQPFQLKSKYNIRQTKRMLYQKVKQQRQLRLSEVDIDGLSYASTFVTFLHIANQKNMVVKETKQYDDVILSWQ